MTEMGEIGAEDGPWGIRAARLRWGEAALSGPHGKRRKYSQRAHAGNGDPIFRATLEPGVTRSFLLYPKLYNRKENCQAPRLPKVRKGRQPFLMLKWAVRSLETAVILGISSNGAKNEKLGP